MKKFISVFIICVTIYCAAIAMIQADLGSRNSSGNYDRSLISYTVENPLRASLCIFGQVYKIDLEIVDTVKNKVYDTLSKNFYFIPDFVINSCAYIGNNVKNLCSLLQNHNG